MIEPRRTTKMRAAGAPLKTLLALDAAGGTVSVDAFKRMVDAFYTSKTSARDCRHQLLFDAMVEVRVHLTDEGRALLANKLNPTRKRSCAKSAPTAVKKATAPTAAPIDSTPLAMAWMGHR